MKLKEVIALTRGKYNLLRLYAFYLVNHHAAFQKYVEQYRRFLRYAERYHSELINIASQPKGPTLIVSKGSRMRSGSFLKTIRGIDTYYRYAAVKQITRRVIAYASELDRYLILIESLILGTIRTMNEFCKFYVQFINLNGLDVRGGEQEAAANEHLLKLREKLTPVTITADVMRFDQLVADPR